MYILYFRLKVVGLFYSMTERSDTTNPQSAIRNPQSKLNGVI
ncbi:hypothetical protein D1AOALGA4SA_597 [Olavius algarvensis Delta 1 endosymbiont]|nr:hypothetical protein D1AOALGA4SA_597 [Olavius algarvensis Delta 1 endosymbiont]